MKRLVRPAIGAGLLLALAVTPVLASHTHVKSLGNGQCVLLAEGAGEESVVLPLSVFRHNPNVDIAATAGRMHPLHVLVHLGQAGEHLQLAVAGTAAAATLCPAGIVND
ncbi:MAG: hypothetical protein ACLGIJ_03180 [Candidatus Limnocylindria bacterium]